MLNAHNIICINHMDDFGGVGTHLIQTRSVT